MNIKDILSDKTKQVTPLLNSDIYSGVYKKTEKIACAVFLITDSQTDIKNEALVNDIRRIAKDAMLEISSLVSVADSGSVSALTPKPLGSLMGLRSMLYVLAAARGVRTDLVDVIAREIDGVVRALFSLVRTDDDSLFESIEYQPGYAFADAKRAYARTPSPARSHSEGTSVRQESGARRESILSIIRARGKVSIKDISDSVTDCSEKTIQRELMSLIDEHLIVREGERRWSRYSLAAGQ